MANGKLRAGVIGLGLGSNHAYAYNQSSQYDLVGVSEISSNVVDNFWDKAKISKGSVPVYDDYKEMIEKENLDVVSVTIPDHLHTAPVCDASNMGVKGIFCEKPLCINLEDADLIVETVEKNGTKMAVDHTRSFVPNYSMSRKSIRNGEIGGLTRIIAHMGGTRAMLFRNGTHIVDLINFFADADPVWVLAVHEQGFEDYGTEYKGEGGKDPALDPGSTLIIEYANGVRAILNSAKKTLALYEIDLIGPNGRIYCADKSVTRWLTEKYEGTPILDESFTSPGYPEFFGDSLIPSVDELADVVLNDVETSSPVRRARHTLEIMLGALKSQDGGNVKVNLPLPR